MRVVLDTNILIDYLHGVKQAATELQRYESARISIVSWMEVMAGASDEDDEKALQDFLNGFEIIALNADVAQQAVQVRKALRIRLPDAIILASARSIEGVLVTRNTKDFDRKSPEIRVPYEL